MIPAGASRQLSLCPQANMLSVAGPYLQGPACNCSGWHCLNALALKVAACCLQGFGCNYFAWIDELEKAAASGGVLPSSHVGSPAASQQGSAGSQGRLLCW